MNELEDKIKECETPICNFKQLEKENIGLQAKLILRNGRILELEEQIKADDCDLCNDLQDENNKLGHDYNLIENKYIELQQQLKAVKTLSRDKVEKLLNKAMGWWSSNQEEVLTVICKLALKTLDWSIVKQDYEKLMMENDMHPYSDQQIKITNFIRGLCADEILKNKEEK